MDVYTLISTCNRESINELSLTEKKLFNDVVVVNQDLNQCLDVSDVYDEKHNIKMLTYKEKGLSKSRNRLLENVDHGIGIITDDDIVFSDNFQNEVKKIYELNPDVDVITFNLMIGDRRIGSNKEQMHNIISIMGVMSCQISFRIESINKYNIKFDERFGLGAQFGSGEENLFLMECLKKGLKVKHVPYMLCFHPSVATTGEKWTKDLIISKGAFCKMAYGKFSFILELYFLLFKRKEYKRDFSIKEFYKYLKEGKKAI